MIKIWTRNYNVNFMATITWCLNFDSTRFLKCPFESVTSEGISGKTSFWIFKKDNDEFYKMITRKFLKDMKSFKKYMSFYEKTKNDFIDVCKKINSKDLKKLDNLSLEGGLLTHPSIIARELKKPCVIGTKIASKVLKDGDLVELDVKKGTVKILNK